MKKNLILATLAAVSLWATSSNAFTINDTGVVGVSLPGHPDSIADEVGYANQLLGMAKNANATVGAYTYHTGNENGVPAAPHDLVTITGAFQTPSPTHVVPTGWEYVIAKYGGSGGGSSGGVYVLWYIGGAGATIPSTIDYQDHGGGLSHFTVFDAVSTPDGGVTALLLGATLSGLGLIRRRLS